MPLFSSQSSEFIPRHIGVSQDDAKKMLGVIGYSTIEELLSNTIPQDITMHELLDLPEAISESEYLRSIKEISLQNKLFTNFIGQGYYDSVTPSVILRNVFENPGWYTQYTPYQAEISQGRLESLLNFQTMVSDLTGLPVANASLLDEATAAAEAMIMLYHFLNKTEHITKPNFFVDEKTFPQTLDVLYTRANALGINIVVANYETIQIDKTYFGAFVQYPNSQGEIKPYKQFIDDVHHSGAFVVMGTDLLALTLITPPGELGADVAIGSTQRFGVPIGYGGPHAAFFSASDVFKRSIPGRIIGISIDALGNRALRMALQTREQHIKREKATSNICTAQALLANMAAMYAVYHGPKGLIDMARRVHVLTANTFKLLAKMGLKLCDADYFDTIYIDQIDANKLKSIAEAQKVNFYYPNAKTVQISFDETASAGHISLIVKIFNEYLLKVAEVEKINLSEDLKISNTYLRTSQFLTHSVFNSHSSETQMLRYIKELENKDLSLNTSMISLGSCTMKLNAATQMIPLSWGHWSKMHPFVPIGQAEGYKQIVDELSKYLCKITSLDYCSLQPNSGAQGEYAGLLAIKRFHEANGDNLRKIIIIPISAHGTNPASAVMAGFKVVVVKALENGYVDMEDLKLKVELHSNKLAGIMITYPSTYGIYEENIKQITNLIHRNGGQVYMDGANMNAQVGLTSPGLIGADVCHLNLHKTFAIPHGGGGPGVGPICVKEHLKPYLPGHVFTTQTPLQNEYAVCSAPYGSASILLISYAYIRLLGNVGTKKCSEIAILNANYMRARLEGEFEILYLGKQGTCAHEFILDLRPFKKSAGIEAEDIAKRLMDYGFHAPTLSFPVPGTVMIEPTESECKAELDRFCDALLNIRREIEEIETGKAKVENNCLKNAPHTQEMAISNDWAFPYTREKAVYALPYLRKNKFWPSIARINNPFGDRNLVCTCEPMESYMEA